ncbi:thiamine biosynthesis protein [Corynebacterium falsenii]|uniref:thiamine biosynthesis protein n=1 Tax=Corynebacterium falsenii TaxID=108486 RepID=UPI001CCCA4F8|nr:thiamine biosynthesis protein [Corynebacterium falsenii]UBI07562.1 thiamine biosynthesis protein [Corynebacterium falsenii]
MSKKTFHQHPNRSLRTCAVAVLSASVLAIAGCSTEEAKDVASDVSSEGNAAASAADSAATSATAALADEATGTSMTITPSLDKPVQPNSELTVKLTGLNPDLGYYVGICKKDTTGRVPDCTGQRGDAGSQQWVKRSGGTVGMKEDGTADVKLKAVPTGENVDCMKDKCVVKLYGDHTEDFKPYADQDITFAR